MSACANCGRDLSGTFCSGCGTPAPEQSDHDTARVPVAAGAATPAGHTATSAATRLDEEPPTEADTRAVSTPVGATASVDDPDQEASVDGPERRQKPTWIPVMVGVIVTAIIAAVVGLVVLPSDDAAAPTDTSTTTTTEATTTTTEATTTTPSSTTTAAVAPAASARNVLDEPEGQFCRDLNAKGYSYAEAVTYWEHNGRPSQMDASGTGIPCQTVWPKADVEARWGISTLGNGIDFNSPLLWGYDQAWDGFVRFAPNYLGAELATLDGMTSADWTMEMLVALAASYCNNWDRGEGGLTFTGADQWASSVAPVLGITIADARAAIDSGIWSSYQYVCE